MYWKKKSFETKVSSVGIFHDYVFKINLTIYAPKFFLCSVIFLGCATFLVTPLKKTSVRLRLASWQGENGNKMPLLYKRSWNGCNNHQNWSNSFFSAFRSLVAFNFTFKSGCLKVWFGYTLKHSNSILHCLQFLCFSVVIPSHLSKLSPIPDTWKDDITVWNQYYRLIYAHCLIFE